MEREGGAVRMSTKETVEGDESVELDEELDGFKECHRKTLKPHPHLHRHRKRLSRCRVYPALGAVNERRRIRSIARGRVKKREARRKEGIISISLYHQKRGSEASIHRPSPRPQKKTSVTRKRLRQEGEKRLKKKSPPSPPPQGSGPRRRAARGAGRCQGRGRRRGQRWPMKDLSRHWGIGGRHGNSEELRKRKLVVEKALG
ncbi:hypothetical protein C8J56DRAFT_951231 [Mycena floridula]|nr:hypothetical protein C8J56DRAFT_951231 [Mycena floridula]